MLIIIWNGGEFDMIKLIGMIVFVVFWDMCFDELFVWYEIGYLIEFCVYWFV